MRESVTYQAIPREGEANHARRALLRKGRERFGEAPSQVVEAINAITDVARLDGLADDVARRGSWEELLGQG
jgi:hypothetical protein